MPLKGGRKITPFPSTHTSSGCHRGSVPFKDVMLLGGGEEKGKANKANMRNGFERLQL